MENRLLLAQVYIIPELMAEAARGGQKYIYVALTGMVGGSYKVCVHQYDSLIINIPLDRFVQYHFVQIIEI